MHKMLLMAALMLPTLSSAQALKCEARDRAQLDAMSQKNLTETYCQADAVITAANSRAMLTQQRAAELQRECLEEKKKISDVLKSRFGIETTTCIPLIENNKK